MGPISGHAVAWYSGLMLLINPNRDTQIPPLLASSIHVNFGPHNVHDERAMPIKLTPEQDDASLAEAQASALCGCWLFDPISQTVMCSAETCRILGVVEKAGGTPYADFTACMSSVNAAALLGAMGTTLAGAEDFSRSYCIINTAGAPTWIEFNSRSDRGPLKGLLRGTVMDVTIHKRTEQSLHALLLEKESLLKEMHHRVKNNLQIVNSLLRMESGRSVHVGMTTILVDMQSRIRAIGLLHEMLYSSGQFTTIDLGRYLKQLATHAFNAQCADPERVRLVLNLPSIQVAMQQAIPCGLIVTELLSNCIKHAFPQGDGGKVEIGLDMLADGKQLCLRVSDTGIGLPIDLDLARPRSMGLQLVTDLARQLRSTPQIEPGPETAICIVFTADYSKSGVEQIQHDAPSNRNT